MPLGKQPAEVVARFKLVWIMYREYASRCSREVFPSEEMETRRGGSSDLNRRRAEARSNLAAGNEEGFGKVSARGRRSGGGGEGRIVG